MSIQNDIRRLTAPDIRARKGGEPIVCLTSYHAHTAGIVDAHCDVILVGDSLGMVMHGLESTVPVTLDMMILQGRAVMRGSTHALVVVDLPFGSYEASKEQAFASAARVMKETGGASEDVSDDLIREGIKLLAECEGIFAETAGGVTVGVAQKLIACGKIPREDSAVICVTGNGLKTLDAVNGYCGKPREIKPSLREFEALLDQDEKVQA